MSKIYFNVPFQNTLTTPTRASVNIPLKPSLFLAPDSPSNYLLSILRFQCDGNALPIFVFEDGKYKITMGYDNAYASTTLVYSGQIQLDNSTESSRYIYNIQQMVSIINNGLASVFSSLKILKPAMPASIAPYLLYRNNTITLMSPVAGYNYNGLPSIPSTTVCSIYVNSDLYRFFDGMNFVKMNPVPSSGCDYLLLQTTVGGNLYDFAGNPSASGTWIGNLDETGLGSWFDVATINLESQFLGTLDEIVGGNDTSAGSNPVRKIITDFTIAPNDPLYRTGILYLPTSEYRRIVITKTESLEQIDFNITWTDRRGKTRPLLLNPNNSFSVKLLFERK